MKLIINNRIFSSIILCASAIACTENKLPHTPTYIQDSLKNGNAGPKLAIIPRGTGVVGGDNFETFQNQSPQHEVISNHEFALGVAEVTFEEYDAFCKSTFTNCPDDNGWGRGQQPVINVSWLDAMAYTEWLSGQTNQVTGYLVRPSGNLQLEVEHLQNFGGGMNIFRVWITVIEIWGVVLKELNYQNPDLLAVLKQTPLVYLI